MLHLSFLKKKIFPINRYRRRAANLNPLTGPALNIARIVMGRRVVTFIIQNFYKGARFIPYLMLAVTERGNGCLGTEEDGTMNWLTDRLPDEMVPTAEAEAMCTRLPMIDLNELEYFGRWGVDWPEEVFVEISKKAFRKTNVKREQTDEETDVIIEDDDAQ